MPIEDFKKFTITSSIENDEDIQAVYDNYIKDTSTVLEVGAGYGQVIKSLLSRN